MGQFDHCTLTDGYVTCDLYVRSWSTTLSANMSATPKKDGQWFTAWQPSQDTMSLVIRQPSQVAQATTLTTLQKWLADQSLLTFSWTERYMNYQCVIKSAPTKLNYDVVMNDINLQIQLLTNSFIDVSRGYTVSSSIESMLSADLVSSTLDDFDKQQSNQNSSSGDSSGDNSDGGSSGGSSSSSGAGSLVRKARESNKQWSGFKVTYNSDGTALFRWTKSFYDRIYTVKLTDDFIRQMNRGGDLEAIVKAHSIKNTGRR